MQVKIYEEITKQLILEGTLESITQLFSANHGIYKITMSRINPDVDSFPIIDADNRPKFVTRNVKGFRD